MTVAARLRMAGSRRELLPDQVSGLQLWLKADALALADNAAVSSWTDSSGAGLHAVQATGTKQPTFKTNIVNGKPVVRFDGTTDTLLCPVFSSALTQPFATLLVCQMTLSGISDNAYIVGDETVGDTGVVYGRNSDKVYAMYSANSLGGAASNAWVVISALFDATSSSIRVSTSTSSGNAGNEGLPRVRVGSNRDGGQYFPGDLAEVVIYDPAPSSGELAQLVAGLGTKYGIAVN